jgi:hypothetical protein
MTIKEFLLRLMVRETELQLEHMETMEAEVTQEMFGYMKRL